MTTKFVSSNPAHGEVYSIQHYVLIIISFLRQVGGFLFSGYSGFLHYDITEILLKVALNTITFRSTPVS